LEMLWKRKRMRGIIKISRVKMKMMGMGMTFRFLSLFIVRLLDFLMFLVRVLMSLVH
jgi:hypothetical protein